MSRPVVRLLGYNVYVGDMVPPGHVWFCYDFGRLTHIKVHQDDTEHFVKASYKREATDRSWAIDCVDRRVDHVCVVTDKDLLTEAIKLHRKAMERGDPLPGRAAP